MAEQLTAALGLDLSGFTAAITQAQNQFAAFAQQVSQTLHSATAAIQQQTQQQQINTQSTNQLAAAYLAMAQAINQQTQGYTQAQAAALAFRQQQAAAAQATQQATQQAQQATQAWRQFLAVAGGVGIGTGIVGMVATLRNLVTGAVDAAVKMDSLSASFKALTGSSAGAARDLAFVRAEANRIGIDFVSAAGAFKGLEAAARGTSLEGQKARDVFTAVSEASRVMGLTSDQTKHVLIALEQMLSKGKVSAEELRRQMGNFLPGAFEIAARAVGVTTVELDKMLKSGQLLSEEFLPKFAAQIRKELGPGLADAAKTAQATFARLGNEIQAIAVNVGNDILKFLQPLSVFLVDLLRKAREAREAGQSAKADTATLALAGTGVQLGDLTPEEQAKLSNPVYFRRRDALLAEIQQRVAATRRLARHGEEAAMEGGGITSEGTPFKAQTVAFSQMLDAMKQDLRAVNIEFDKFGGGTNLDKARAVLGEVGRTAGEMAKEFAKTPALLDTMPPKVRASYEEVRKLYTSTKQQVEALEAQEKAEDKAARAAEQALKRRQELINNMVQGADVKLRSTDPKEINADLEYFNKLLATETGPRLDAVKTILMQLDEAKQKALGTFPTEVVDGLKVMGEAWGDLEADIKKGEKAAQEYTDALKKLDVLLGKGESPFEKQRVQIRQQIADIEVLTGQTEKTQRALAENLANINEAETKSAEQEAKKQEAVWIKLADSIQRVLSNAFYQVLQGSKSVFEGIRDLFYKLIADIAASAITGVLVSGIKTLLGAAVGASGTSGAGILGTIFQAAGFTGGGGGSGGGTDTLGLAQNALGTASSTSGALGGPTTTSLLGSLFEGTAAASYFSELAATPIFGGTTLSGAESATALYGDIGAQGLSGTGGAAVTLGQAASAIVQGVGTGIAVGMILKEINDLIGVTGKAGGALAGAGGGAAGGALIGAPFGPAGSAVGAIIGTIVGAIGGWFLSKNPQKPTKLDLTSVQTGQVGLDAYGNLTEMTPFAAGFTGKNVGKLKVGDLNEQMSKLLETMFQQAIGMAQGLSPEVQKALVAPFNAMAESITEQIQGKHIEGRGEGLADKLTQFMNKDLPKVFQDTLGKLIEGAKKIDPLVRRFNEFIDGVRDIVEKLKKQNKDYIDSLNAQIKAINEGAFTPAQLFEQRKKDLADLQKLYTEASPAGKLALVPKIQDVVGQLFDLGKTVLGTPDPNAVKQLQDRINEEMTKERPNLANVMDLQNQITAIEAGNKESRLALKELQKELTKVLTDLGEGTNTVFKDLESALSEQIALANSQIALLTDSLADLDSIDANIDSAMKALALMIDTVGILEAPGLTQTQFSQAILAQVGLLEGLVGIGAAQLSELRRIAGGGGVSSGGDGGGDSFQHGTAYVPHNMYAFLHQGERVIPAYQNNGSGGATVVNITIEGSGNPEKDGERIAQYLERRARQDATRIATRPRRVH